MSGIALSETNQDWLIHKPVWIVVYIVLAIVVRFVLHRVIDQVTKSRGGGDGDGNGGVLRGLFRRGRGRSSAASPPISSDLDAARQHPGGGADGHDEAARQVDTDRLEQATARNAAAAGENESRMAAAAAGLWRGRRNLTPEEVREARLREERQRERRAQRATTIGSVLKSTVSFLVLIWVVLQILALLGVNVAPFIASAGIIGVALGFGAQALVRDFLSGLFMLFEDQYGVGDVVDLGDAVGTVESVGLRVTTVRDKYGTLWYCRNGEIMRVGNYSQDYAVAFLLLPISYGSDVDLACQVALETARAAVQEEALRDDVLAAPEMLGVDELGADSVTLRLTVTVRANTQWTVERELRRRIRAAFAEHGIRAPYPTGLPVSALQKLSPESPAE